MIYLIADTHFGHANIIKYCNRPFSTVDEMNTELIKRWNDTVTNSDKVFVLGDFALGSIAQIKEWGRQLNGSKILIRGNHDRYTSKVYQTAGFKQIIDYPILLEDFFLLSHTPLFTTTTCSFVNIYGHVHNDINYRTTTENSRCISVERTNYAPIPLDLIKKEIEYEQYKETGANIQYS